MGEEHPHVQVAERANACETFDKLVAPGGPLVLCDRYNGVWWGPGSAGAALMFVT